MNQNFNQLKSQLHEQTANNKELSQEISQLKSIASERERESETLSSEKNDLKSKLTSVEMNCKYYRKTIEQEKAKALSQLTGMKTTHEDAMFKQDKSIEELKGQLGDVGAEVSNFKTENDLLNQNCNELKSQLKNQTTYNDKLSQEISHLKSIASERARESETLSSEKNDLKTQVSDLTAEASNLKDKVKALKTERSALIEELPKVGCSIKQLLDVETKIKKMGSGSATVCDHEQEYSTATEKTRGRSQNTKPRESSLDENEQIRQELTRLAMHRNSPGVKWDHVIGHSKAKDVLHNVREGYHFPCSHSLFLFYRFFFVFILEAIILPRDQPQLFTDTFGCSPPKGVLMFGPTGTGIVILAH